MKINYYPDTDSAYIDLLNKPGVDCEEVAEGIVIDRDDHGSVVGIDVQDARKKNRLRELRGIEPFSSSDKRFNELREQWNSKVADPLMLRLQLLFSDPTYDKYSDERQEEIAYSSFIRSLEKKFAPLPLTHVERGNVARGADWPTVIVALPALFFLGKPIRENLQAWLESSKQLTRILANLKGRYKPARIDENSATLICLGEVMSDTEESIRRIDFLSVENIYVSPRRGNKKLSPREAPPQRLDEKPDAIYVRALQVNGKFVYYFVLKSDTTFLLSLKLDLASWHSFESNEIFLK